MLGPGMHPFLKTLIVLGLVLFLFLYAFVKSHTLEVTYEQYTRNGMPYERSVYNFHWDRFTAYVKATPEKVRKMIKGEP